MKGIESHPVRVEKHVEFQMSGKTRDCLESKTALERGKKLGQSTEKAHNRLQNSADKRDPILATELP